MAVLNNYFDFTSPGKVPPRGYNWNAFEGCCVCVGSYYAVWPKIKASDDYDMLLKLSCQQYWVETEENKPPGVGDWKVIQIFEEEPKP